MVDDVQRRVRLHRRVGVVLVVGALAAVEVLVDPRAREGVEAGDGLAQRARRHADLPGELLERGRLAHDALLEPPAGEGLTRHQAREDVAVAVALVDDHPGRHVTDAGRLTGVHRVHGLDVGERLVHVALSGLVDDDRAGQVALGEAEPRASRQRDGRAPPAVVHQVGLGARGDAGEQTRAGVELRAGGPVGRRGLRQELLAQRGVALESAAAEDHPAPGPDDVLAVGPPHAHAGHAPVLEDQVDQLGLVVHGHPGVHQAFAQADRDRVAHRVHPPPQQPADQPAERDLGEGQRAAQRAHAEADLPEVGLGDDHVRRRLGVRRVQPLELGPEEAGVQRDRLHGAPAGATAGLLGVVVGVVGHPREAHRGLLAQEVQNLRATVDVGVAAHLGHDLAHDGVQVELGVLQRVVLAGLPQRVVAGDPHPAAAAGGRAAEVGALLHEDRLEPARAGCERGRHPGAARTDDDDIDGLRQFLGREGGRHGEKL